MDNFELNYIKLILNVISSFDGEYIHVEADCRAFFSRNIHVSWHPDHSSAQPVLTRIN